MTRSRSVFRQDEEPAPRPAPEPEPEPVSEPVSEPAPPTYTMPVPEFAKPKPVKLPTGLRAARNRPKPTPKPKYIPTPKTTPTPTPKPRDTNVKPITIPRDAPIIQNERSAPIPTGYHHVFDPTNPTVGGIREPAPEPQDKSARGIFTDLARETERIATESNNDPDANRLYRFGSNLAVGTSAFLSHTGNIPSTLINAVGNRDYKELPQPEFETDENGNILRSEIERLHRDPTVRVIEQSPNQYTIERIQPDRPYDVPTHYYPPTVFNDALGEGIATAVAKAQGQDKEYDEEKLKDFGKLPVESVIAQGIPFFLSFLGTAPVKGAKLVVPLASGAGTKTLTRTIGIGIGSKYKPLISLTEGKLGLGAPKASKVLDKKTLDELYPNERGFELAASQGGTNFQRKFFNSDDALDAYLKAGKITPEIRDAIRYKRDHAKTLTDAPTVFYRDTATKIQGRTPKESEQIFDVIKQANVPVKGSATRAPQLKNPEYIREIGDFDIPAKSIRDGARKSDRIERSAIETFGIDRVTRIKNKVFLDGKKLSEAIVDGNKVKGEKYGFQNNQDRFFNVKINKKTAKSPDGFNLGTLARNTSDKNNSITAFSGDRKGALFGPAGITGRKFGPNRVKDISDTYYGELGVADNYVSKFGKNSQGASVMREFAKHTKKSYPDHDFSKPSAITEDVLINPSGNSASSIASAASKIPKNPAVGSPSISSIQSTKQKSEKSLLPPVLFRSRNSQSPSSPKSPKSSKSPNTQSSPSPRTARSVNQNSPSSGSPRVGDSLPSIFTVPTSPSGGGGSGNSPRNRSPPISVGGGGGYPRDTPPYIPPYIPPFIPSPKPTPPPHSPATGSPPPLHRTGGPSGQGGLLPLLPLGSKRPDRKKKRKKGKSTLTQTNVNPAKLGTFFNFGGAEILTKKKDIKSLGDLLNQAQFN